MRVNEPNLKWTKLNYGYECVVTVRKVSYIVGMVTQEDDEAGKYFIEDMRGLSLGQARMLKEAKEVFRKWFVEFVKEAYHA